MKDYKLPRIWLGKSITVMDPETRGMIGKIVTEDMVEMNCTCQNEAQAFFCQTGHLTECHVGRTCRKAGCSHLERYDPELHDTPGLEEDE